MHQEYKCFWICTLILVNWVHFSTVTHSETTNLAHENIHGWCAEMTKDLHIHNVDLVNATQAQRDIYYFKLYSSHLSTLCRVHSTGTRKMVTELLSIYLRIIEKWERV